MYYQYNLNLKNIIKKKFTNQIVKISIIFSRISKFVYILHSKIYPWTGKNNLDRKIAQELPFLLNKKTFYVEAGANDGIKFSNTNFLEKLYGAQGILIEASPSLFEKCYS